jgi:hypothetical protein
MAIGVQVVFDCADPDRLANFWAEALGYELQPPPEGFESWEAWATAQGIPRERWNDAGAAVDPDKRGPRLFFQRVPEPKAGKNRLHLDVSAGAGVPAESRRGHVDAEVRRLVGLGASVREPMEQRGEYWVVMQDPEGNEFCVQ